MCTSYSTLIAIAYGYSCLQRARGRAIDISRIDIYAFVIDFTRDGERARRDIFLVLFSNRISEFSKTGEIARRVAPRFGY